jgi:hypothetical protein
MVRRLRGEEVPGGTASRIQQLQRKINAWL